MALICENLFVCSIFYSDLCGGYTDEFRKYSVHYTTKICLNFNLNINTVPQL